MFSTLTSATTNRSSVDLQLHPTRSGVSVRSQQTGTRQPHRMLPETLIHMGSSTRLTADQMRFMGSVESLGRYGIPVNASSGLPMIPAGATEDVGGPHPPEYSSRNSPASRGMRMSIDTTSPTRSRVNASAAESPIATPRRSEVAENTAD